MSNINKFYKEAVERLEKRSEVSDLEPGKGQYNINDAFPLDDVVEIVDAITKLDEKISMLGGYENTDDEHDAFLDGLRDTLDEMRDSANAHYDRLKGRL